MFKLQLLKIKHNYNQYKLNREYKKMFKQANKLMQEIKEAREAL